MDRIGLNWFGNAHPEAWRDCNCAGRVVAVQRSTGVECLALSSAEFCMFSCSWRICQGPSRPFPDVSGTGASRCFYFANADHPTTLDFDCGRSNRLGVCDEIARLSNLRDCQSVSQPFSAASTHLDAMSGAWPESKDALGIPTTRTTWTNSRGLETLHKYIEQHCDNLAFDCLSQKNNSWQNKKFFTKGRFIFGRRLIQKNTTYT